MPDMWMDVDTSLSEVPVNKVALIDDTDFKTREEAVVYNQAGMDLVWNFVTTGGVFTQTAVTPTTGGDYDWTNQGNGMYSIEIPASGGASINNDTEGFGWFTGFATGILPWTGPVIGFRAAALNDALVDGGDNLDVNLVQWLGTAPLALTSQLVQTSVGAMQASVLTATAIASNAITSAKIAANAITSTQIADGALTAAKFAAGAFDAVWTVSTRTLTSLAGLVPTNFTALSITAGGLVDITQAAADKVWLSAARTLTSFGTLVTDIWAAGSRTLTSLAGLVPANFTAMSITAGGLVDITQAAADKVWLSASRTLTAFSTALAVSVWDVLEAAIVTASSIGVKVKTNLDVAVSSRSDFDETVDSVIVGTNNDKTGYGLTAGERTSIADALLTRDFGAVVGAASRSMLNALRFLRNRKRIAGGILTVYEEDDTTPAWTAAVTEDATANPVTEVDPA